MSKLILTIATLVITMGLAKAHECETPVSSAIFKHNFNHILAMRGDEHRLKDAKHFVEENCLLSRQVKQIATLFHSDRARLKFAKAAYLSTFDKRNFYDVYDAFNHFSNAFRLHDYVLAQRAHALEPAAPVQPVRPITNTHKFPSYDYPSTVGYNEDTFCDRPVSERSFHGLVGNVIRQSNDVHKIKVATRYGQYNCLSTAQIMKIGSMIQTERNRFIYLKTMFDNVFDVMNFGYADQLFSSNEYHNKFQLFLTGGSSTTTTTTSTTVHTNQPPPPPPPCGTSPAQFEELKKHIASQNFNSTKVTVAKQVIRAKECFTARQIAELLLLFAFDDDRLEIAKFAYDFCDDRSNYFLVNNSFTFDSTVEKLTAYISTR
ncbi:MAG: DUF4476 domain-containing protein [Flavobacteriales bacterium]|nr:DUF4476 domain-containing protein [Flavobacteriales bacterium]